MTRSALALPDAFFKNANMTSENEIRKAVAHGRWMTKELEGVIQLKKYRAMKHRYDPTEQ